MERHPLLEDELVLRVELALGGGQEEAHPFGLPEK